MFQNLLRNGLIILFDDDGDEADLEVTTGFGLDITLIIMQNMVRNSRYRG